MSQTRDLVTELMVGEQETPAMTDPRKSRRKRKHQNADDTKPKHVRVETPTNSTSVGCSSDDNASTEPFPKTPQNVSPEPSTAKGPTLLNQPAPGLKYPVMGQNGYSSTPPIKQAVPQAPYKAKPQEVRLPLGDDVFLTVALFRDKPLVSVRQFYRPDPADVNNMKPGRHGLSMSPQNWEALKTQPMLATLLDCLYASMPIDDTTFQPTTFDLGDQRYVMVQKSKSDCLPGVGNLPSISLYQMYRPYGSPATTPPMKKGIDLSLGQWNDLEAKMETVDKILAAMAVGKMPTDKDVIQSSIVY